MFTENMIEEYTDSSTERETWKIDNDQQAEWALKKIREAQEDITKWKYYYQTQLNRITEASENTVQFFTGCLKAYFDSVPHSTTKGGQEKYRLPSGELVLTAEGTDFERNEDELIKWCEKNAPEFVKVKKTVDWAGIKKAMKENGIIPDGVEPVKKEAEFKVRV